MRPRVALVDDERSLRDVLEVGLTQEGFDVRTAEGGSAAPALSRERHPEAVMLDVMMPVVDGINLIPCVSAQRRPFLDTGEQLCYADLVLNLNDWTARRAGRILDLSPREFDLAAALLRRPRRVFSRNELLDLVWGSSREVTGGTVDAYVHYLRAKIDAPPARPLIKTVRGVGYTVREDYP